MTGPLRVTHLMQWPKTELSADNPIETPVRGDSGKAKARGAF